MKIQAKADIMALAVFGICIIIFGVGIFLLSPSGEQSKLFFRKCLNDPTSYASCQ